MAKNQKVPVEYVARLGQYWFRADLMHEYVHTMMELYERDLDKIHEEAWFEFETYLSYWLSALFVVVEGVNKSGLKDARVQRLFNAHLRELKGVRHSTYHFALKNAPLVRELNWAEELHEAVGEVIREHVTRKAHVERFFEIRAKRES